jgi:hypothetical protein
VSDRTPFFCLRSRQGPGKLKLLGCNSTTAASAVDQGSRGDLVEGSGIAFRESGERELKGVPDQWRLVALEA